MAASAGSDRGWKKSRRAVPKGLLEGQLGGVLVASLPRAADGPRHPRQWPGQHTVPKKIILRGSWARCTAGLTSRAFLPPALAGLTCTSPKASPSPGSCCSVVRPRSTSAYCSSCLLGEIQRHSHLLPHQTLRKGKGAAPVEERPSRLGWDRLLPRGDCFPHFTRESICLPASFA